MKKFLIYLVVVVVFLGGLLRLSIEFEGPQNTAMQQFAGIAMQRATGGLPNPDALRIFVCGSASPLGQTDQAQACLAVLTPNHFYIVDTGAGSTANVAGLPTRRLQGIFLTHFHSDHIAEVYELNLNSWVQGRPVPLMVYGPKGVNKVVNGINESYGLDRQYRTEHHGADLLPPELGVLHHTSIRDGIVLEDGDLTVTAYIAEHDPVSPAYGYRFDYRGRSVVISGDSNVTDETKSIVEDADILFHDALSVPAVTTMASAAKQVGADRLAKIATDVLDYHASTESIIELGENTDLDMVAYYHLVPNPGNILIRKFFERDLPDNFVIATDGSWFELPADSSDIILTTP